MLGQPSSMLIPPVRRLPADGQAARRRDGHGPRADDHRGAPQEGRRRQVRRVLRPGPGAPDDCRSRHARQHVPGVRRDGRDLPDRRHDARLPAAHRPRRGAGRAGRGLRARRRACSAPTTTPDAVYTRDARARSRQRGAEPGRSAAPAGSRAADEREGVVRRPRCRNCRRASRSAPPAGGGAAVADARRSSSTASVVIAAITSCTNTSNPSVMIGAGLVAKKAVERGPDAQAVGQDAAWRPARRSSPTTSTRPASSRISTQLGFNLVGYGCTTCIGNSGPLPDEISAEDARARPGRRVRAERQPQLRGPHPAGRARQLPCVAAARRRVRAGRVDERRHHDGAAGHGHGRQAGLPEGHLADRAGNAAGDAAGGDGRHVPRSSTPASSTATSAGRRCRCRPATASRGRRTPPTSASRRSSRTCRRSRRRRPNHGARVLALLGDSITTDHISPAGSIKADSPAGKYLIAQGVAAEGLQLLRRAPRQPRGDDARHVRQRAPEQPARARHRRRRARPTCPAAR